jgi:NADPH:quinone reductase-like Zn-dependent oxidoreductase
MGLVGGGGYAERLVTDLAQTVRIPRGMQFVEGAAVPEAFWTAFDALVLQGGLREGMSVLVHAAGSGVGTAALQVARAFGAERIYATASRPKLDGLVERNLPMDVPIDYRSQSFRDVVRRETRGQGVDLILDLVGAAYWSDNVASLATRGRVVLVGLVGGTMAQLNLGALLRRRIHVIGTVMRSREPEEKADLAGRVSEALLPRFEEGQLRPVVDRVFPLDQAAEAHRLMEDNRNLGKIVLKVSD